MKTIFVIITLFLSTSAVLGQTLNAPVYDYEGFYLGASLLGAAWSIDDVNADAESGAGIGLRIGYNFNQNFGAYLGFDGSSINPDNGDSYALGHFDIGVQWVFRSVEDRFRPYVRASYLGMSAQDDNLEINGAGFGLGLGTLIFLTEKLAFDVNYSHSWISLSEVKIGSQSFEADGDATSGRFFLGLAYHF